jgi:hypothetical protein
MHNDEGEEAVLAAYQAQAAPSTLISCSALDKVHFYQDSIYSVIFIRIIFRLSMLSLN